MNSDSVFPGAVLSGGQWVDRVEPVYLVALRSVGPPGRDGRTWWWFHCDLTDSEVWPSLHAAGQGAAKAMHAKVADAAAVVGCDRPPSREPREAFERGSPSAAVVGLWWQPDLWPGGGEAEVGGLAVLADEIDRLYLAPAELAGLYGGNTDGDS